VPFLWSLLPLLSVPSLCMGVHRFLASVIWWRQIWGWLGRRGVGVLVACGYYFFIGIPCCVWFIPLSGITAFVGLRVFGFIFFFHFLAILRLPFCPFLFFPRPHWFSPWARGCGDGTYLLSELGFLFWGLSGGYFCQVSSFGRGPGEGGGCSMGSIFGRSIPYILLFFSSVFFILPCLCGLYNKYTDERFFFSSFLYIYFFVYVIPFFLFSFSFSF